MRMAILHSRVTGSNVKQSRSSQKFSCARSLTALWQRKRYVTKSPEDILPPDTRLRRCGPWGT